MSQSPLSSPTTSRLLDYSTINPQGSLDFAKLKRVGIIRLSAIGDILNLLPTIEILCRNYPQLEVYWVIGKNEYHCFKQYGVRFPNLRFVVFDKKASYFKSLPQARKDIFALTDNQPLDLLIHAQTSLRSNFLALAVPAKAKVGYSKERSFEGHSLITKSIPQQNSMHVMYDYFELFAPFFAQKDQEEFYALVPDSKALYALEEKEFAIYLGESKEYPQALQQQDPQKLKALVDFAYGEVGSKEVEQYIQEDNLSLYRQLFALSAQGRKLNKEECEETCEETNNKETKDKEPKGKEPKGKVPLLIFLNPASSALKKNWTYEGYCKVVAYLLDHGHHLVITGSNNPKERGVVDPVVDFAQQYAQKCREKYNQQALTEANNQDGDENNWQCPPLFINLAGKTNLAELIIFTQLADLVISPDSGPMHLASCLGVPTLGLFAYINPMRSGPIQGLKDTISVYHQNFYGHDNDFSEQQYALDLKNWRSKPPKAGDDLMQQISPQTVVAKIEEILNRLS